MIVHRITPIQFSLNAVTLPSATGNLNSSIQPCAECSAIDLWVNYTFAAASNLQYQVVFYQHYLQSAGTNTFTVGTDDFQAVSESVSGGVGTLSLYNQIIAVSASIRFVTTITVPPGGADSFQLKNIFGTSSTTDAITIAAVVSQVGSRT